MTKRISKNVALFLILILCFGSSLSIASTSGGIEKGKKPLFYRPAPRKATGPNRTKPLAARVKADSFLPGQTITLLPDGSSLLIGGESENGPQDRIAISDLRTGAPIELRQKLNHARAWHSATMLPDGRILILGGIGENQTVVSAAEVFDPQTHLITPFSVPEIAVRAYHSATLLTDGQVLITGGQSPHAARSGKAILWDYRSKVFKSLPAKPAAIRQKHKATLLYDGNVLIEGGTDERGARITNAELFNVESASFSFSNISAEQADQAAPFLAATLPANGATDVPLDTLIGLRFSKQLRVETLNPETLTLLGPEGTVEAKIVAAESGRLVFVTPKSPLLAGVTYTVSIDRAIDDSGSTITPATSTFTTKESPESIKEPVDTDDWVPNENNFHGNWDRKHKDSPWRSLPLLQAEDGITALSGQVLTLDGKPLNNVTFRIAGKTAQTDNTGRFLLSHISAGHQVMVIDGRTASRNRKVYGVFKVGVDIKGKTTNPLGYTVWMPKLDTARAKNISSPTTTDTVLTNPAIPGLELRLPKGTVIRDVDGQTVTQISITPIPTNQPPFPLPPNVDVPIYFTIQPGGSQIIPPRAQLIYPNFINSQPGTRIDFYNYDPSEKGWYIYGKGTVTPDGKQIIPDAGVTLYEFSGAMVAVPALAPGTFVLCGRGIFGGSSVDLNSGLFLHGGRDLMLPGLGSLSLNRTYRPNDTRSRAFGIGASHTYDLYLVGSTFPYTFMDLVGSDGSRLHFNRISAGTGWADAEFEAESCGTTSCALKARIRWNGGGWILIYEDGTKILFPEAFGAGTPQRAAMIGYEDPFGNSLTFVRDSAANLTRIAAPSGRWMDFTYDTSNRITQAKDNIGRTVTYAYDTGGRLASVTNPTGGVRNYAYDVSHRMTDVTDERGVTVLKNEYDSSGRIIKQTFADNTPELTDNPFTTFAYTLDSGGRVVQTDVTDPSGLIRRVTFDANGYTASDTSAFGLPEQRTTTYERQEVTNLILSVTDHVGRKVAYTYDTLGRVTDVTSLAGTAEATTTHYGYSQDCECEDITSITDPLNHTVTFEYDSKQNLTKVTDPLNNSASFTYNTAGQPLTAKDSLNNTTQMSYDNGDVVAVTDATGLTATAFIDSAGRLLSSKTPFGQASRYEYDALNRPIKAIDAHGGITEFSYDAKGNVTSYTDARNNITSYIYDNVNRLVSRTDALQHTETFEYDEMGSLKKFTDRRGKVTSYIYDDLQRLSFVGFGTTGDPANASYESTVSYSYDTVGRLSQVTDSTSGVITYGYDNFDQITSRTTPQGTISYTYDAAGRRTSMTVAGQPPVNYTYDSANHLTQVVQGTNTTNLAYDSAGRVTSISRSNGITVEYTYNQASNLTSIVYTKDATVIGNLTYEYDALGKRTKMAGTLARTGLSPTLNSATYGTANRLTLRDGANFSYDENGNVTSDGTITYNWNGRNQLTSMTGPGLTASFQYDSSGRRVNKTINGVSTSYLYDGLNAVQELSGTTPTANQLVGGTDRVLTRTDASGPRTPLTDGQGSTLALADDAGTLQTEYTYDAFGNTTASGTTSSNSSKFTGRDDDGTGLYYYRARYYSPSLQRFISEDPAGLNGGDVNLYAYVKNDPANLVDPSGMCSVLVSAVPIGQLPPAAARFFPEDQRAVLQRALDIAIDVLRRPACATFLTGISSDPLGELIGLIANTGGGGRRIQERGFINHSSMRPRSGNFETHAEALRVLGFGLGVGPAVALYGAFFDNNTQFGLNADQTRALTILHELGHVTRAYFHSDIPNFFGFGPEMSQDEVDNQIFDRCFRAPLPRGVI